MTDGKAATNNEPHVGAEREANDLMTLAEIIMAENEDVLSSLAE